MRFICLWAICTACAQQSHEQALYEQVMSEEDAPDTGLLRQEPPAEPPTPDTADTPVAPPVAQTQAAQTKVIVETVQAMRSDVDAIRCYLEHTALEEEGLTPDGWTVPDLDVYEAADDPCGLMPKRTKR
jgi:hypothetical protein